MLIELQKKKKNYLKSLLEDKAFLKLFTNKNIKSINKKKFSSGKQKRIIFGIDGGGWLVIDLEGSVASSLKLEVKSSAIADGTYLGYSDRDVLEETDKKFTQLKAEYYLKIAKVKQSFGIDYSYFGICQ